MDCFVIMPFGEKSDASGRVTNFDDVYHHVIQQAVTPLGLNCIRCDDVQEAGWIHSRMFDMIYKAKVAVVDITSLNPNVFYELGVRHALADQITVIIRRRGTVLPFNIQDFQVIDYDPSSLAVTDECRKKIANYIKNGLDSGRPDSPVHNILKLKIETQAIPLEALAIFSYKLQGNSKARA